ncbi:MAG: NYN domain-containing protein [Kosmotoga sp.]|nr:MAG: NYN domain-containing protein [Kosmotoga sp.]
MKNYAFIDGNNLYLGLLDAGWKLDYVRFNNYLKRKYDVMKSYYFIGYIKGNENLYESLKQAGFHLIYKTVLQHNGIIKGNCDAELVLQAMIDINYYDEAVLVTSDGDFSCLVKYLGSKNKLRVVLSPSDNKGCSSLLKKAAAGKMAFMSDLRSKLAYKK